MRHILENRRHWSPRNDEAGAQRASLRPSARSVKRAHTGHCLQHGSG
ncbi:hypothetical protein HMPREF1980_00252 [Actinomyces sp. oral taxon 172 str. F0311]|nr:hypothetical protein HMPREF1980_00252 [Actinomyces sp. oral taxon 172 str. F0311]